MSDQTPTNSVKSELEEILWNFARRVQRIERGKTFSWDEEFNQVRV